jgi:hypothetical protein
LYLLKEKPMLLTNLRKPFCTTFLVSGLVLGVSSTPINAIPLYPGSDTSPQLLSQVNGFTLKKAQNAARQAIEELNGGLQVYQAEFAMHGPAQGAPFTDDGNYWTFTFVGGPPGWTTPSIRSIVEVSKDGEQVNVVYNGSVSGSVDRDTDRRSDDDSEDLTSTDFDAENLRWNNLSTQLIQEDNWTGLLGLSRLSNTTQDALVISLDVLDRPTTRYANAVYQIYAYTQGQWRQVYSSIGARLITTESGAVRLPAEIVEISDLRLNGLDIQDLPLKTIVQLRYDADTEGRDRSVSFEFAETYQNLLQVSQVTQIYEYYSAQVYQSRYSVDDYNLGDYRFYSVGDSYEVDDDDEDDRERKPNCNQGIGNGAEGCDPGNSSPHGGSNDEGGRTPGRRNK